MKKNIYVKTRSFRTTAILDAELQSLADKVERNDSDLIREAVWAFVKYYRDCPDQIVRSRVTTMTTTKSEEISHETV